jgi:hypothetical protein
MLRRHLARDTLQILAPMENDAVVPPPTPAPNSGPSMSVKELQIEAEHHKTVAATTSSLGFESQLLPKLDDAKHELVVSATQVAARRRSSAHDESIMEILRRADLANKQLDVLQPQEKVAWMSTLCSPKAHNRLHGQTHRGGEPHQKSSTICLSKSRGLPDDMSVTSGSRWPRWIAPCHSLTL